MTIAAESSKVIYTANGSLKDFAIPYYITDKDQVQVYTWDPANPDTAPVLYAEGTGSNEYGVLNVDPVLGLPGDTIRFVTAPATGLKVILLRVLDVDQQVLDALPNVSIPPMTLEASDDSLAMILQQHQEQLDRSLKLGIQATTPPKVPAPDSHKLLRWDLSGTDLENVDPGDLAISLGDLTPVDINNPQSDDVLLFNGTSWVNQPSPSATPDASDIAYTDTFSVGVTDSQAAIDVALQNVIDINTTFGAHLDGNPGKHQASEIDYDPTSSGLLSGTVQDAIDELAASAGGGASVSDIAYNATSWDGDTTNAPSKNAVRDKIEAMVTAYTGQVSDTAYDATSWDGVTSVAPSKNAVRDKIEAMSAQIASAGGGGGGSFVWRLPESNSPAEATYGGYVPLLDFSQTDAQELWGFIQVPSNYVAGTQIFLTGMAFVCSVNTGNVKFKATTYLVRTGAGNMTATAPSADSYASTNSQVAVSGTAYRTTATGNIDLTNASGQINSVAVAAGDYLAVKLIRDTTNETSGAAADARLLRYSASPKFN